MTDGLRLPGGVVNIACQAYAAHVPESPPLAMTVFYDVHCPYSDRVLAWLADLGPGRRGA